MAAEEFNIDEYHTSNDGRPKRCQIVRDRGWLELLEGLAVMKKDKLVVVMGGLGILSVPNKRLRSMDGAEGQDGIEDSWLACARLDQGMLPKARPEKTRKLEDGAAKEPAEALIFSISNVADSEALRYIALCATDGQIDSRIIMVCRRLVVGC